MKITILGKFLKDFIKRYFVSIRKRKVFLKTQINLSRQRELDNFGRFIVNQLSLLADMGYSDLEVTSFIGAGSCERRYTHIHRKLGGKSEPLVFFTLIREEGQFVLASILNKKELNRLVSFVHIKKEPSISVLGYRSCISFDSLESFGEIRAIVLACYTKLGVLN